MEMKKDIRKQPGKVGNSEEVEEAAIMMMKTIIKHLRVAVPETHVVVKAEAGMGMKKNIHKEEWKVDNVVPVEAVITMKTIRTIKGLHAVGMVIVAVTMTTKTITTHRHAAGSNSRRGEGRGWYGDEEGHSEAAMEGWQNRRGGRSRDDEDDDDYQRSSRGWAWQKFKKWRWQRLVW
jgi:hypothetical protein